ncbi:MAG: 50S ribosomal protein L15 [Acidobacteriota bacterium]
MAKAKAKANAKARAKPKAKPKAKPRAKARPEARPKAKAEEQVVQLTLGLLRPPAGSTRPRLRVGRGPGSGIGKTSGRGQKGEKARSGGGRRPGFEGGQMPLIRRIPKRGFTNPFKQDAQVVNVRHLGLLAEGAEVTPETLFGAGLVRRPDTPIKLLGMGDVQRRFVVKGVGVSGSARQKIEAAGGVIEGVGA